MNREQKKSQGENNLDQVDSDASGEESFSSSQSAHTIKSMEYEGPQLRPRIQNKSQEIQRTQDRIISAIRPTVTRGNKKGQSHKASFSANKPKRPPGGQRGKDRGQPSKTQDRMKPKTLGPGEDPIKDESSSSEDSNERETEKRLRRRPKSSATDNLRNQMSVLTSIVEKLSLKLDDHVERSSTIRSSVDPHHLRNPEDHCHEDYSPHSHQPSSRAQPNIPYQPNIHSHVNYNDRPFIQTLKTIDPPSLMVISTRQ